MKTSCSTLQIRCSIPYTKVLRPFKSKAKKSGQSFHYLDHILFSVTLPILALLRIHSVPKFVALTLRVESCAHRISCFTYSSGDSVSSHPVLFTTSECLPMTPRYCTLHFEKQQIPQFLHRSANTASSMDDQNLHGCPSNPIAVRALVLHRSSYACPA